MQKRHFSLDHRLVPPRNKSCTILEPVEESQPRSPVPATRRLKHRAAGVVWRSRGRLQRAVWPPPDPVRRVEGTCAAQHKDTSRDARVLAKTASNSEAKQRQIAANRWGTRQRAGRRSSLPTRPHERTGAVQPGTGRRKPWSGAGPTARVDRTSGRPPNYIRKSVRGQR